MLERLKAAWRALWGESDDLPIFDAETDCLIVAGRLPSSVRKAMSDDLLKKPGAVFALPPDVEVVGVWRRPRVVVTGEKREPDFELILERLDDWRAAK